MSATRSPHHRSLRAAVPAVALLLALGACTQDDQAGTGSTAATSPAGTSPDGTAVAAAAGWPDELVQTGADGEAIVAAAQTVSADNDLTSLIFRVTRDDEVLASGALGENMTGVPATQDLHFRNGNVAFAYLGTLLLLFDEAGDAHLDDPVGKWLPDWDLPNADTVTLQMLTDSTSGYPDYVPNDDFIDAFLDDPFGQFTPDDLLAYAFATPPWYEPGTAWNYAHTNYVILGAALAAIGGAPVEDLLAERIFAPLGLDHTTAALTPAVPAPALHTFTAERDIFEESTFWNPSWQTAPGTVLTTNICDMATSARAVGTGELLTDASFDQMTAPTTVGLGPAPATCPPEVCRQFTEASYYGLGVLVMNGWILQAPNFAGSSGVHAYFPGDDLAVAIVAVNGEGSTSGANNAQALLTAIAELLTPDNIPAR